MDKPTKTPILLAGASRMPFQHGDQELNALCVKVPYGPRRTIGLGANTNVRLMTTEEYGSLAKELGFGEITNIPSEIHGATLAAILATWLPDGPSILLPAPCNDLKAIPIPSPGPQMWVVVIEVQP